MAQAPPRTDRPLELRPPKRPALDVGADGCLPQSPTVLLLIDFINPLDFPGAERLEKPALRAAKPAARLKRRMSARGFKTIYANDNYGQWRSEFRGLLLRCQEQAGASGEIARLLAPAPDDLLLLKPRHSAFFGTPLDVMLTQMNTKTLVIAGLATDICVHLTAMDANLRGYRLWVPADCTAAESPAHKAASLAHVARVLEADTRVSTRRRLTDA